MAPAVPAFPGAMEEEEDLPPGLAAALAEVEADVPRRCARDLGTLDVEALSGGTVEAEASMEAFAPEDAAVCRSNAEVAAEYLIVTVRLAEHLRRTFARAAPARRGWIAWAQECLGLRSPAKVRALEQFGLCIPRSCLGFDVKVLVGVAQWYLFNRVLQLPAKTLFALDADVLSVQTCCGNVDWLNNDAYATPFMARKVDNRTLAAVRAQEECGLAFIWQSDALLAVSDSLDAAKRNVKTNDLLDQCEELGGDLWMAAMEIQHPSEVEPDGNTVGRPAFSRICAPRRCSRAAVQDVVAPTYLEVLAHPDDHVNIEVVEVERLVTWSRLRLDAAIVGFPKCGTTALGRWLSHGAALVQRSSTGGMLPRWPPGCRYAGERVRRRGPRQKLCSNEDHFFVSASSEIATSGLHLTERRLRCFNDRRVDAPPRRGGRHRSRLRFAQLSPLVAYSRASLEALAQVRRLRLIVAVRDPAEQFVSFYNMLVASSMTQAPPLRDVVTLAAAAREYYGSGVEPLPPSAWPPFFESRLGQALLFDAGRFREGVSLLRQLFGAGRRSRVRLVHLDELQVWPARTLQSLRRFLGIPRGLLPSALPSANRGRGLGELCGRGNESLALRRDLRLMLADDYEALYGHGAPFRHLRREPCSKPSRRLRRPR